MGKGPGFYMKIDSKDIEKLGVRLRSTLDTAVDGAKDPMTQHARFVMGRASFRTPLWTGALMDSAFTEQPKVEQVGGDEALRIRFGYASPETDRINPETGKKVSEYVIEVHEEPWAERDTGTPWFLQVPFEELAERYFTTLRQGVKDAFRYLRR